MATLRSLTTLPRSLASSSSLRRLPGIVSAPIRHYAAPKKPAPQPSAPKPAAAPRPVSRAKQAFMLPGQTTASRRDLRKVDMATLGNLDIPFIEVHLVGDDGLLGPLRPLREIVSDIDTQTHVVRLKSMDPPVVRIIGIEEEKAMEREKFAKQKLSRRLAVEDKEIQVGWHSARSDMEHKARTARQALEKGDRVHIIFATRVGGSQAMVGAKAKAEIVSLFDDTLEEVGEKWKEDERVKGLWVLYYQPRQEVRDAAKERLVQRETKKKLNNDKEKEARRAKQQERQRLAKERMQAELSGDAWD